MPEQIPDLKNIRRVIEEELDERRNALRKYPTVFALLVTFSAVMMFKGFEELMLRINLFDNNPWIMILIGAAVLFFTGSLYKKLNG